MMKRTSSISLLFFLCAILSSGFLYAQTCCNMLLNGDFESGDVGFTTDLPLNCNCAGSSYCIDHNFTDKCSGWPNLTDHTTNAGQFLIVDGHESNAAIVWRTNVGILPANTTYCFSFWLASVYPDPFDLAFLVNGNPEAIINISQGPIWTKYSVTFTTSVTASTFLAIQQLTGGGFQDFGLDDIEFGAQLKAGFIGQSGANCGLLGQFINQSMGIGTLTYAWSFGDTNSGAANTSTIKDPVHQFSGCGFYNVCLTVKSGNCSDTYCESVEVNDFIDPVALCLGIGVVLNPLTCTAQILPSTINAGSSDDCGIALLSVSPTVLTGCGLFPVTLTVTDFCDNQSTCTAIVQTIETVPPNITCPPSISVNAIPTSCSIVVNNIGYLSASDNCSTPTIGYTINGGNPGTNNASGNIFNQGASQVVYTATDGCGNTKTCSFSVTVTCQTEECACLGGAPSGNLISNGNFSSGYAGFTSGLTPSTGCGTGLYNVGTNFTNFCGGWPSLSASSPPNFLMLDGSGAAGPTILWQSQVNIVPNMEYCFSFKWASAYPTGQQSFPVEILIVNANGTPVTGVPLVGSPTIAQSPAGVWQSSGSFIWGSNLLSGTHYIAIRQLTGGSLRDWGIDDICFTKITPPPTCLCGNMVWAQFYREWDWSRPIICGSNNIPALQVPCLKPGQNYFIHGDFTCSAASCGNSTVTWILNRPSPLLPVSGIVSNTYPHFDISLAGTHFSAPGNYTLTVTRNCGGTPCSCTFKIEVLPCDCTCARLQAHVAQGFSTSGNPFNCVRRFKPIANLCSNDAIRWHINGPVVGTSTGNGAFSYTFTTSGVYWVCMVVTRTDPFTGQLCTYKRCRWVSVKCPSNPSSCANTAIRNGDFTQGMIPGQLGQSGSVDDWKWFPNTGDGAVFADSSGGSGDDGYLVFDGGKDNFGAVFQSVDLTANAFINLDYEYFNLLGSEMPAGTVLEFRLHADSMPGSANQVIYTHAISSDTSMEGWQNRFISIPATNLNPDYRYLIVCVRNDDNDNRSLVGLDNLTVCTSNMMLVGSNEPSLATKLSIVPNPNNGTFTVVLPEPGASSMLLRITDLTGRVILEQKAEVGTNQQTVLAESMPNGLYFLQVVSAGKLIATEKFVKQ